MLLAYCIVTSTISEQQRHFLKGAVFLPVVIDVIIQNDANYLTILKIENLFLNVLI